MQSPDPATLLQTSRPGRPLWGSVVPSERPSARWPRLLTPAARKAMRNRMLLTREASAERVAALTGASSAALRDYRRELAHSSLPDLLLQRGADLPFTRELPQGALLYLLVRALRPRRAVETGVRPGYSTAWILAAMEANGLGELVSIGPGGPEGREIGVSGPSVGQLVAPALRARWTLVLGNSLERLGEALEGGGAIDLFFSDNGPDPARTRAELKRGWAALGPRGVLLAHRIDASSAWTEFCRAQGEGPGILDAGPPPLGALGVRGRAST